MATKDCHNCGAKLAGAFCHRCGQKQAELNAPFKELFSDFVGDIFTFDTKFFRSLFPLFFKPGFLTNQWIAGRRAAYIPPFRLYIFVSILFFVVFGYYARVSVVRSEPKKAASEAIPASGDSTQVQPEDEEDMTPYISLFVHERSTQSDPYMNNFSRTMFLLLPIFALILKVLYRRQLYVQHLIFSFHIHAFSFLVSALLYMLMFLSISLFSLSSLPMTISFPLILLVILPVYLYLSLKNVYREFHWKTFVKFLGLVFTYFIIFTGCFAGTSYLTSPS